MGEVADERQLEVAISRLLRAGVLISALFLLTGWVMTGSNGPAGRRLMETGLRVLMSTPILRVAATFVLFLKQRDLVYSVITAIVLGVLAIGVFGGIAL